MSAEPSYFGQCSLSIPPSVPYFLFPYLGSSRYIAESTDEADTHLGDDMFVTLYEKFPVASERKNTPFFPSKRKCVAVLCHKRCTLHVANDSPPPLWVVWGLMRGPSAARLQALWEGDI